MDREGPGDDNDGRDEGSSTPSGLSRSAWESNAARAALPVMAVAALVAVVAAGVGLLLPGAELSSGGQQAVRICGVALAVAGLVALVLHRRQAGPSTAADVTAVALGVAAVVMGLLALLALPYSDVELVMDEDEDEEEEEGWTTTTSTTSTSPTTATPRNEGTTSGRPAGVPGSLFTEDPMFTVGVNPSTGEPSPIAVDPLTGFAVAIDPETGDLTPMQLDPAPPDGSGGSSSGSGSGSGDDAGSGTAGGGSGSGSGSGTAGGGSGSGSGTPGDLGLPVGIDTSTGEAGVIGVTDPETGELGVVYEMDDDAIEAFESEGAIHVVDDLGDIVPLDAERLAEFEGDIPSIDFGELDYDSYVMDEAPGGWGPDGMQLGEIFQDAELSDRVASMDFDDLGWDDLEGLESDRGPEGSTPEDGEGEAAAGAETGDDDDSSEDEGFFDQLRDLFTPQLLVTLLLLAALGVATMYAKRLLGRDRSEGSDELEPEPDGPVTAGDAEAGLAASLDEAQESGDPRQRIMAAYMRLLEALAAAGAPRQMQEAPHEHLGRVLDPLGVRPEPVHELAELFVQARFSDQPVTEEHRIAAVEALEASLADLRAAPQARAQVHPSASAPAPPAGAPEMTGVGGWSGPS